MIKLLIVTVMLLTMFICHAQGQTDERQLYKHKIEAYSQAKNFGNTLLFAGIVSIGAGVLIVTEGPYSDNYTLGAYVLGFGIDMIIGGFILNTIGNRKVKQYQEKLNNLSAGIRINQEVKGFSLVYRF